MRTNKRSYRILAGATGQFNSDLKYDFSLNWGESKQNERSPENRLFDRYMAAMDAVFDDNGQIVCRSSLNPASFNQIAGD
ncbi:hypothetical protein [Aliikangiella maris]|uniref:Uncharacterized protein n=2 Tax=Aliikangiella maris TaxID=3162458 RepID=A0ABV3MMD4_9GAMM